MVRIIVSEFKHTRSSHGLDVDEVAICELIVLDDHGGIAEHELLDSSPICRPLKEKTQVTDDGRSPKIDHKIEAWAVYRQVPRGLVGGFVKVEMPLT
jgi:hypothetical protein